MHEKIKAIKQRFRQTMNGIVSQNMRTHGVHYKINFGITLPLMKLIAGEQTPDARLAAALWDDKAVRESMMLAPMLYPVKEFTEETAERWAAEIPHTEIADICCKFLFCHTPFALTKALAWSQESEFIKQYTGFQLATAWLLNHREISDEEATLLVLIAVNAYSAATGEHINLAFAATTFLKQAVHDNKLAQSILSHPHAEMKENKAIQHLVEELKQEQELFNEFSQKDSH